MRFAILAYSCVYSISASSKEEALNRLVSFAKERGVMATLSASEGKSAFNIAHVGKDGSVKKFPAWESLRRSDEPKG